jgi:UDP-3-O-[3-hydroxymyristoyl] N-acetylglucosamine deacetylase/3-hydroxyacyl-[acyl-carrier-protein] dehydratase
MNCQKTISREQVIEGVGLHTGNRVRMKFMPAGPNSGINFVRVDLPGRPVINASVSKVIDLAHRPRRTTIGEDGVEVQTVEHLMASLSGLGIDNITVEVDNDELPGLDGSASPFVQVLKEAGVVELDTPRKSITIREPIWIEEDGATLAILPAEDTRISYTLSYEHPLLKAQYITIPVDGATFEKEIAPSRTFCLQKEANELRKMGLGKGANYENTIVVGDDGIIKNQLRFEDEFVRHKILDLIGDMYLLGMPVRGHIVALKSGHSLNIKLFQKIKSQEEKYRGAGVKVPQHVDEEIKGPELDINMIQRILPHRYPFLFVDKIVELEEDKYAVGIKNITIDEGFFSGHFPGHPVMPGVLIVEAMAQVAGVLMLHKRENRGKLAYFMSIDNVKFRKIVVPGDQLRLEVAVVRLKSKTGQVHTRAFVDGKVVSEADLMFSLVDA